MSYITTIDKVKTIIPHQAIVSYLVKDFLIEQKIANVTTLIQGFMDFDYNIGEALIASSICLSGLNVLHIGITDIINVKYCAKTGYEYIDLADTDYSFKNFDFILDEVYKIKAYTLALSREFIEQIIYGGSFLPITDIGYIQYTVVGGNDDGVTYTGSLSISGSISFFMNSIAQQILINNALNEEGTLSPIIQLLAAYIVAKDIIVEYILPVFKQDQANNLAGVQLNFKDLLPGFEEFLDSCDDKIADFWALLKFKGKIFVNPDGPDGPEDGCYANQARSVVRGERTENFDTPFNDANDYYRRGNGLDEFLNTNPYQGI
jgi:hypothetical protein